jgi:hypothetical protein
LVDVLLLLPEVLLVEIFEVEFALVVLLLVPDEDVVVPALCLLSTVLRVVLDAGRFQGGDHSFPFFVHLPNRPVDFIVVGIEEFSQLLILVGLEVGPQSGVELLQDFRKCIAGSQGGVVQGYPLDGFDVELEVDLPGLVLGHFWEILLLGFSLGFLFWGQVAASGLFLLFPPFANGLACNLDLLFLVHL